MPGPRSTAYPRQVMVLHSTPSQSGTTDALFQHAGPSVVRFVTGSADPIGTPATSQTYTDQFNKFNPGNKTYTTIIAGGAHNSGVWDSAYSTKGFDAVHNAFVWAMMVSAGTQSLQVMPAAQEVTVSAMNDAVIKEQLILYPNPVQDVIHIKYTTASTGNVIINVYDISGRLVHTEETIKQNIEFDRSINVTSLHAGMYNVEVIIGGKKQKTKQFIKQ